MFLFFATWCVVFTTEAVANAGLAKRIVSTSLASDEILYDLLENKKRLVAVSALAANPRFSSIAKQIKTSNIPVSGNNLEAVLSLAPDLVFVASFNRPSYVKQLQALKAHTVRLNSFNRIEDIKNNIRLIAAQTATASVGQKLIDKHFQPPPTLPKTPRTALLFNSNLTLPGTGTLFDDICRHAGLANLASRAQLKGWAKIDPEILVGLRPNFIVVARPPDQSHQQTLAQVKNHKWFGRISKHAKIIALDSAPLSSVSHHINTAIAALRAQTQRFKP